MAEASLDARGTVGRKRGLRSKEDDLAIGLGGRISLDWRLLVPLDSVVNFATMDGHFFWGFDAQAYLVASNLDYNDCDVIIDDNTLVFLAG
jgi:hypothetical protein